MPARLSGKGPVDGDHLWQLANQSMPTRRRVNAAISGFSHVPDLADLPFKCQLFQAFGTQTRKQRYTPAQNGKCFGERHAFYADLQPPPDQTRPNVQ